MIKERIARLFAEDVCRSVKFLEENGFRVLFPDWCETAGPDVNYVHDVTKIIKELCENFPSVDVTTVVFCRDFAGMGCCVIPEEKVIQIVSILSKIAGQRNLTEVEEALIWKTMLVGGEDIESATGG